MSESPAFEWLSAALEERTAMNRLAARGTVRIALKRAGFRPDTVLPLEMVHVLRFGFVRELEQRGVEDAETFCQQLGQDLQSADLGARDGRAMTPVHEAPETVFRRIFGNS